MIELTKEEDRVWSQQTTSLEELSKSLDILNDAKKLGISVESGLLALRKACSDIHIARTKLLIKKYE